MCKFYRNRLIERGQFVTLRQKAQSRPAVSKLIGAVDFHLRGNEADQRYVVDYFASHGVKNMLLNSGVSPEALADWKDRSYSLEEGSKVEPYSFKTYRWK